MKINLGKVDQIVFIGGGDFMIAAVHQAKYLNLKCLLIIAERHKHEMLLSGESLSEHITKHNLEAIVLNCEADIYLYRKKIDINSIALCFGPAWIFSNKTISIFNGNMFNFNGIPLPNYMGGAHYTWQILNGNRDAACHIQRITNNIDKGDLIYSQNFSISNLARKPIDYFSENLNFTKIFLKDFLGKLTSCKDFTSLSFSHCQDHSYYFPRVKTLLNGWIDWSWMGLDVERFCLAFSDPYPGASTMYKFDRVFIKDATFYPNDNANYLHPFCTGLISRVSKGRIWVLVAGGLLAIDDYYFQNKSQKIVVGERFYTKNETLESAKIYRPRIDMSGNLI